MTDRTPNTTVKTARERLLRALADNDLCFCGGEACPTPEQYVDAYAHQLAEQIRNSERLRDYTDDHMDDCNQAADEIDPEAQR